MFACNRTPGQELKPFSYFPIVSVSQAGSCEGKSPDELSCRSNQTCARCQNTPRPCLNNSLK